MVWSEERANRLLFALAPHVPIQESVEETMVKNPQGRAFRAEEMLNLVSDCLLGATIGLSGTPDPVGNTVTDVYEGHESP